MRNLLLIVGLASYLSMYAQQKPVADEPSNTATAIEFPEDVRWLNTPYPLSLKNFDQRFLMLNFWTSSSSLCLAQLEKLKQLQAVHKNLDIVIVHSGKYEAERNSESLRKYIIENEIPFPVINDSAFSIWEAYQIEVWPTNLLINPEQQIVYQSEGVALEGDISTYIQLYSGDTRSSGGHGGSEINNFEQGLSLFPEFVESDGELSLFISERRAHRIVQADINGIFERAIGSGYQGFEDGYSTTAKFSFPGGLAYHPVDSILYISDAGNHAIRKYDLKNDQVTTILGNGHKASTPPEFIAGTNHGLNHPNGLLLVDNDLYIAMTGWNQIWKMSTQTFEAEPVAGSGETGFEDGKGDKATLAEPFDLAFDGDGSIYFTDQQSNAVRMLKKNKVTTLTGAGIFEFGDIDGKSSEARMSGPAGITFYNDLLYVVDQFNHKIKTVDPNAGRVETLLGSGETGFSGGAENQVSFHHPSDLVVLRNQLFITDTYNQLLRRYDFENGTTRPYDFENKDQIPLKAINEFQVFETDTIHIPEGMVHIEMVFELDSLYRLISGAPQSAVVTTRNPAILEDPNGINPLTNSINFSLENDNSFQHFFAEVTLMYFHEQYPDIPYYRTFTLMVMLQTDNEAPAQQVVVVGVPKLSAH